MIRRRNEGEAFRTGLNYQISPMYQLCLFLFNTKIFFVAYSRQRRKLYAYAWLKEETSNARI